MPTETNTNGEFRLRIMCSYKALFILKFNMITISYRFGTSDASLCKQQSISKQSKKK
jgi:hypothetical protein